MAWMNQFESDTLRLAIGLFVVFCIAFCFLRYQFWLWISLPRIVIVFCVGWFVSVLIVIGATRTTLLQGPLFVLAYLAVALTSPPLLAAGMIEVVLGLYASFTAADRKKSFPARPHFMAALSSFACLGAY